MLVLLHQEVTQLGIFLDHPLQDDLCPGQRLLLLMGQTSLTALQESGLKVNAKQASCTGDLTSSSSLSRSTPLTNLIISDRATPPLGLESRPGLYKNTELGTDGMTTMLDNLLPQIKRIQDQPWRLIRSGVLPGVQFCPQGFTQGGLVRPLAPSLGQQRSPAMPKPACLGTRGARVMHARQWPVPLVDCDLC